jgi:hypothetical protein
MKSTKPNAKQIKPRTLKTVAVKLSSAGFALGWISMGGGAFDA